MMPPPEWGQYTIPSPRLPGFLGTCVLSGPPDLSWLPAPPDLEQPAGLDAPADPETDERRLKRAQVAAWVREAQHPGGDVAPLYRHWRPLGLAHLKARFTSLDEGERQEVVDGRLVHIFVDPGSLTQVRPEGNPDGWFKQAVSHAAVDHLRARGSRERLKRQDPPARPASPTVQEGPAAKWPAALCPPASDPIPVKPANHARPDAGPDALEIPQLVERVVEELLATCDACTGLVFVMHFIDDLTVREIAPRLNMSSSQVGRDVKWLRERFEELYQRHEAAAGERQEPGQEPPGGEGAS